MTTISPDTRLPSLLIGSPHRRQFSSYVFLTIAALLITGHRDTCSHRSARLYKAKRRRRICNLPLSNASKVVITGIAIDQITPALDSKYVKDEMAAGKTVECRVYLSATEAERQGLTASPTGQLLEHIDGGRCAGGPPRWLSAHRGVQLIAVRNRAFDIAHGPEADGSCPLCVVSVDSTHASTAAPSTGSGREPWSSTAEWKSRTS